MTFGGHIFSYLVGYCRIVSECHFSWDYPPGCMDWHLLSFLWNIWMMSACVLILVGVSYTDDMMKTRVFVAQEWSQCDRQTCLFWETNVTTIKIQVRHAMVARLLTVGKWSDEFPRLYPMDLAHLWIRMLLFWDQCHMIVYSFGLIFFALCL